MTCRFVNADGYVSTGQGITGNNMYAYCNNNPVAYYDPTGTRIFECCPYGNCWQCKGEDPPTPNGNGCATEYVCSTSVYQNCLGYVLGIDDSVYIGGYANSVHDFDIENVSSMLISTLESMDIGVRPINGYYSYIKPNEYRIAMRTGPNDYHFMVQHSDGSWSQKTLGCSSSLINGDNPTFISWDAPKITQSVITKDSIEAIIEGYCINYYDSYTAYFAISKQ